MRRSYIRPLTEACRSEGMRRGPNSAGKDPLSPARSMMSTISSSSRCINQPRLREHPVPDVPVHRLLGHHIDPTPKHVLEGLAESDDRPGLPAQMWITDVEHIHIAVLVEVIAQDAAEERQLRDVEPPADLGEAAFVDFETLPDLDTTGVPTW